MEELKEFMPRWDCFITTLKSAADITDVSVEKAEEYLKGVVHNPDERDIFDVMIKLTEKDLHGDEEKMSYVTAMEMDYYRNVQSMWGDSDSVAINARLNNKIVHGIQDYLVEDIGDYLKRIANFEPEEKVEKLTIVINHLQEKCDEWLKFIEEDIQLKQLIETGTCQWGGIDEDGISR